jgi:nucleoside-diphosphate-sugar epimerase
MARRTSNLAFVADLPVEWAYADVRDPESLHRACQDIDYICHCAALTRAPDRETMFRVNCEGTRALAEASLNASPNLRRFLFVSSQAAVGPSSGLGDRVTESQPPRPITWYGASKWAAEQALRSLDGRLPLTIVRPGAIFGPRDADFFAYFSLVKRGLDLQLGRKERSMTPLFVRDVVELLLLAMESEIAMGKTYFACGEAISYTRFSQAIARVWGKRTWHIVLPESVLNLIGIVSGVQERLTGRSPLLNRQRLIDLRQPHWLCSAEKARRELGFKPGTDLDAAIEETVRWYEKVGWL